MVITGNQWWIYNILKLSSTNNKQNTSEYVLKIKFTVIIH